ncbi:MAG TPA: SDR family NAD(P)-dependent oxidoreductase [Burkholderiales bacterium]|nr:SDR family NAD(P)-dependent oxidoreductase [Burkholderiales bacterium]
MPSGSLDGKVAWITGGGSGIGLAGAIELATAGAHVVISGRNEKTLYQGLEKVKAAGSAEALLLDVSNRDAIFNAAEKIGRVDILVNSAGVNSPKRNFRNVSAADWESIVAINLHGTFYCIQAVLPGMRSRKDGLVINIASWFGKYWNTLGGPGYNSTKHAVVSLTETLNVEECANGIRATAILPGEVATPILEKRPVPPSMEERARMLQAEDLGRAILFVSSLPPRACVNELVISPTWNRFFLGGLEVPKT